MLMLVLLDFQLSVPVSSIEKVCKAKYLKTFCASKDSLLIGVHMNHN